MDDGSWKMAGRAIEDEDEDDNDLDTVAITIAVAIIPRHGYKEKTLS
jgi:hypothetical protein